MGWKGGGGSCYVEVTREAPATVVFELLLTDDNPAGPANRLTYRAERLPSIYP